MNIIAVDVAGKRYEASYVAEENQVIVFAARGENSVNTYGMDEIRAARRGLINLINAGKADAIAD